MSGLAWRAHGATSYADQTSRLAAANHTPVGAACRGLGRCLAAPRGPDRYTPNRRQRISSKGGAVGLRRSLACLARDVKAALRIVFSVYRFREGLKRSATLGVRLSLVCREDWSAGSSSTAPEGRCPDRTPASHHRLGRKDGIGRLCVVNCRLRASDRALTTDIDQGACGERSWRSSPELASRRRDASARGIQGAESTVGIGCRSSACSNGDARARAGTPVGRHLGCGRVGGARRDPGSAVGVAAAWGSAGRRADPVWDLGLRSTGPTRARPALDRGGSRSPAA